MTCSRWELGLAQVTGPAEGLVEPICPALCLVVQQQGQSRDTRVVLERRPSFWGPIEGNRRQTQGACNGNGELWASQKVTHSDGLEVLVSGEESGHR